MNKDDRDLILEEMRETAIEWANEHALVIGQQYIGDQLDEGVERAQYGDIIGGSVCMLRANAMMLADSYTLGQLKVEYDKFNKACKMDMLGTDPDKMLKSMKSYFELCGEVNVRLSPHTIEDRIEKETSVLRANLYAQGNFIKGVSEMADKMREKIGEITSIHDCDNCDKDKTQCAIYTSGVYKAVIKADARFKEIIKKDLEDLDMVIMRKDVGRVPIEKIHRQFPKDDDLDARFSLTASTAIMIMGACELPLNDCAIVSDVLERYKKYEDTAYGFFEEECEKMGFTMDQLHDIADKERKNHIPDDLLDTLKDALTKMFGGSNKPKPSDKKDDEQHKPGNIKFGKN